MIDKLKNLKEVHIITIVVLALFSLALLMHVIEQNKLGKEEIEEIQSYLDAGGNPEEIDLYDFETQVARDYAEQTLKDYEAIIEASPAPTVSFITPYTIEEQTYNLIDGQTTVTDYVINTGNEDPEFTIEFTIENGDEAVIHYGYWTSGEEVAVKADESGVFRITLKLEEQENNFTIDVANQYKNDSIDLIVRREETKEEQDLRLKIEQNDLEWAESKAGQICSRHTDWEKYDCTKVANGNIWIGMSYEMLVEQRGKPTTASPSNYGYGTEWQWCWSGWTPFCFYDEDDDGIIDSYN